MRLKNKKTGETGYYLHTHRDHKDGHIKVAVLKDGVPFSEFKPYEPIYDYDTLKDLVKEWEDYEEPKEYWFISDNGYICNNKDESDSWDEFRRRVGNHFETKEEAELAVRKLKAWKRLKDKGFKVDLWDYDGSDSQGRIRTGRILFRVKDYEENDKGLDLLFSGEARK